MKTQGGAAGHLMRSTDERWVCLIFHQVQRLGANTLPYDPRARRAQVEPVWLPQRLAVYDVTSLIPAGGQRHAAR